MATGHQLAQLIDSIKDANDWSDVDLVKNAAAKGYLLSKSNISRYRNPLVSIKGDIIRALAAGLRITPAQVALAALESMGVQLPRYETPTAEQAVRLDIGLSDRDKESVLALLRSLRRPGSTPVSIDLRGEDTRSKPPAADDDTPPTEELAEAARSTDPEAGKGRSEQGEAPDGGA